MTDFAYHLAHGGSAHPDPEHCETCRRRADPDSMGGQMENRVLGLATAEVPNHFVLVDGEEDGGPVSVISPAENKMKTNSNVSDTTVTTSEKGEGGEEDGKEEDGKEEDGKEEDGKEEDGKEEDGKEEDADGERGDGGAAPGGNGESGSVYHVPDSKDEHGDGHTCQENMKKEEDVQEKARDEEPKAHETEEEAEKVRASRCRDYGQYRETEREDKKPKESAAKEKTEYVSLRLRHQTTSYWSTIPRMEVPPVVFRR
ncbi:hypothetical protein QBC34DRAFT_427778 [Podospora aff. communis PSN243]|uniref:Uncharacterized protein n=1 Tax=Podospora aff. communis PSN243 TaxID=3040156 RepID=A0AAV9GDT3_9PEZI|nr:hypothetical protein QBC34DRAFT_427778 [Podospora aff. communis PSN243]